MDDEAGKSATRAHLIGIAIDCFGLAGPDGISTRELARRAGRPMSAITYHFGGKDGLYLAAARHIAAQLGMWLGAALDEAGAVCGDDGDAAAARAALRTFLNAAVGIMTRPETEVFARFIIREQSDPTEAFNVLYEGFMERVLDRVTALLARASGGALDPLDARVRAVTLFGQILVFRIARAAVLRATGWSDIGPAEQQVIGRIALDQLDAILDRIVQGEAA
ncbi:CerR family C-terminal domain-containing protein [Sphingosinicella microcystinivorans]|uniref:CerR family C-terminal domain-containing protein n=1 Tax=Sphingosinicella microcystinivorans TaxID=335406 RepID=UPI0022F3F781|nr:CerR family C-terminal domain-containing protein [Sphingosinicella microcystinivorans]WBX84317.1 CerR family C-terminal domain-containing protein [Sphingosinicella microcystinivorans]